MALITVNGIQAQTVHPARDSAKSLAPVTITGARFMQADNVIDVRQVPMPVTIIDKKTIALMGSRRLDEVLREQTGMSLVSDLGAGNRATGLQLQGFSSEYITILLNGQPLAGRNSGNFDLSRISVSGIERIEIIKGASSSLFGSEALGGVVNIITRQLSRKPQGLINILYGTNQTLDAGVDAETPFASQKGAVQVSGNFYRTDGFNVNPYLQKGSQTAPPYNSLSWQGRARYNLNPDHTLHMSMRYASRQSVMTRSYGVTPFEDVLKEHDLNSMLSWNYQRINSIRFTGRYYFTRYASAQRVNYLLNDQPLQQEQYTEYIHRVEVQAARDWRNKELSLITGTGAESQATHTNKQGAGGDMYNYFAFIQANYKPVTDLQLMAGARYDGNNLYGGKMNPSVGISYTPLTWITVKAAMGKGFKSPTYRQLYQVFTNITQGYTVLGAQVFNEAIHAMQEAGQVQQIWPIAATITRLKPETSTSWNAGCTIRPLSKLEVSVNGFYNNIRHLITNQQVGIKTNGAQLFSWFNINRLYTTGVEAGLHFQPLDALRFSGGYQLLYAKDPSIIDSIQAGAGNFAYVRSPNAIRRALPADYFGLPNRSRHMANLQVMYAYTPWQLRLSARAVYRSRNGFMDQDNNGYIDQYDVFVKGYCLLYASLQKQFWRKQMTLQISLDNINDYTDMLMPAQPGRMIMAGLSWQLGKVRDEQK
jgi:outer membrane receptor for ferrienterochelin and colicins